MIEPVGVGAVGLGGFGQFALAALTKAPEVRLVAVYDEEAERTAKVAARHGAAPCGSYEELLAHPGVEVVYLATPPAHHGPAAIAALERGRHVWVEKPLATSLAEAEAMARLASSRRLRVGVDYVLRYNPMYRLARFLGEAGFLGQLRHLSLENDAADDHLPPDHWFWDAGVSGGILVEHGVHFFDIAAYLSGAEGEWESSQAWVRPRRRLVDRVVALVRFGDVPATFYHGFDKPRRIERAEFRLAYDVGYVTVKGWMPSALELEALVDETGLSRLQEVAGRMALDCGAGRSAPVRVELDLAEPYQGGEQRILGRELERRVTHRVRLAVESIDGKETTYARAIEAAVADFARAVREPEHTPEVTLEQALSSLRLALAASRGAAIREPSSDAGA
ncbi:MAG: Gfo/Idh/MocA family oxidoreductase [Bacillota bacterium]|nr:Gfo/Idh/MocA family oxidoreductase [Bacillota bacterium]